jgi:predicted amidophosphoribosyltransferase
VAAGPYEGALRTIILAYKERGAHRLAGPLGDHLARAIMVYVAQAGLPYGAPVVIVPVPTTSAAVRARRGDHMARLARRAVRQLGRAGWPAVIARPLSARPKADSTHLSASQRADAAAHAFTPRVGQIRRIAAAQQGGAAVIAVDDVLTTGATMAALATVLAGWGCESTAPRRSPRRA